MERSSSSILDGLGEEIIRIISPVSVCMLLVVLLVSVLKNNSSSSSSSITTIATFIYDEQSSDSGWEKLGGALLNALVFVAVVTVVTFLLVLLFYYRCTKFLRFYMGFAAFIVLAYMGGGVAVRLVQALSIPIDCITFGIILFNFAVVGIFAVFLCEMPIIFTQGYLVLIGMLVAYWFTMLPEWTTWTLLVAMALYDIAAVLIPGGPLKLLVELAMSRDEEIPALIYEARPVSTGSCRIVGRHERVTRVEDPNPEDSNPSMPSSVQTAETPQGHRTVWKRPGGSGSELWKWLGLRREEAVASASPFLPSGHAVGDVTVVVGEEEQGFGNFGGRESIAQEEVTPLVNSQVDSAPVSRQLGSLALPVLGRLLNHTDSERRPDGSAVSADGEEDEGIGLAASGAIKLGLGDFIFYSVLVGRAAMYDYMTVYACYFAIIAGLGVTLILLAFCRKALPALPVSVSLGVIFYFLTRFLLEGFVVQLSTHLLLF